MKYVFLLLLVLIGGVLIGGWFASGYVMSSAAMEPAIAKGDTVLVNRMALRTRQPRRGEIVLLQVPEEEAQVVRRVIAFAGETVEIQNGEVFINGQKLDEPWIRLLDDSEPLQEISVPTSYGPEVVEDDSCFVLGDNRGGSVDSRSFGQIKRDQLLGRVWTLFGFLTL